MEENISEKNGFIRLALGTGLTAIGASHLAKEKGSKSLGLTLVIAGAMKVAEGIFLYCPAKALINSNVKDAMTTTFEEFMDGDSLMTAFGNIYKNSGNSSSKGSSSGTSQNSNSTMQNVTKTAANVAETVSKVTPSGTPINTAAKAAETLTKNMNNQKNNNKSK